jgi:hypothetical protein
MQQGEGAVHVGAETLGEFALGLLDDYPAEISEPEAYALAAWRLASAADRLGILDLIGRADAYASSRDADAYAGLFTDDAVLGPFRRCPENTGSGGRRPRRQ